VARAQQNTAGQGALPFPARRGSRKGRAAAARGGAPRLPKEQQRTLMERLNRDGGRIAAHFGLRFRAILPERPGVVGHYGICYEDGLIKIRLQHATRGTPLKYSSLLNTLCHELAHLKHFHHGETFRHFYYALLEWARREGIYRPRAAEPEPECSLSPEERRRIVDSFRQALRADGATPPEAVPPRAQLPLFTEGA
jgi:hypothetical protein